MSGPGIAAFSLKQFIRASDLVNKAQEAIQEIDHKGDVSSWMDLMRTCRQPQVFWAVDYIEPQEELIEINRLIRESEAILYKKNSNIYLKDGYTADVNQLSAFNTIRAHLRAEEGHIATAEHMFQQMLRHRFDELSLIRKSNLLFHGCLSLLCCGKFQESYDCFEKHWGLLKYASPSDRISQGLEDNHNILTMIYWFFIKNVENFRDFYAVANGQKVGQIWNHKKIALLYFLEHDSSWAISFCGLAFYNYARSLFPSLPIYEKKRSTPTNHQKIWLDDEVCSYAEETQATGKEQYYFEQYNREIDLNSKFPDQDTSDDYLYSYYHYQTNYPLDQNAKMKLVDFIREHIDDDDYFSVLEAGSSLIIARGFAQKSYTCIDISSRVCEILQEKDIEHEQGCISVFLSKTEKNFDLCFAYDILNHLNHHRLQDFLYNCSKKCTYLAAAIDTEDDFRNDILSKNHGVKKINLHRTVRDIEGWRGYLESHFKKINMHTDGKWIYVFCQS